MTSPPAEPKVLVVGAGPSGLVLALSLLRNGVPVRIVEKNTEHRKGQRGAAIMPRSMEIFHFLGVHKRIMRKCIPTPPVRMYELQGGSVPISTFDMAPIVDPTPDSPYLNIQCLGQDTLEGILRDELESEYGCRVELGSELVSFEQSDSSVNVKVLKSGGIEEHATFDWLVGTDGARGVVRKLIEASFLGETSNIGNIAVGDVYVSGLDDQYWHMWGDPVKCLVSLRPTETTGLFSYLLSGEESVDPAEPEALRSFISEKIGGEGEIEIGEIPWRSIYRPNIRMVDRMRRGNVFLAGDSAHVHSFTGGQGMNSGIQDSFNLAWKLAYAQQGHSLDSTSLLQSYTEERLPVIAEMLRHTSYLMDESIKAKENPSGWKRDPATMQLEVHYRWSPVVLDEQDAEYMDLGEGDCLLRAGDRAPDAPGLVDLKNSKPSAAVRLFDLFGCSHHTVLVLTAASEQSQRVLHTLKSYPASIARAVIIAQPEEDVSSKVRVSNAQHILVDRERHVWWAYREAIGDCEIVIVRPDGVVGAVARNAEGVATYFKRILGY